ncbi:hypothetical protein MMC10_002296 [Thelotrema lepadinum]|nr:hypothetical protein [Thelotrema lepadinum]
MDDPSVDAHLYGDPSSSVLSDQLLADQEALVEEAAAYEAARRNVDDLEVKCPLHVLGCPDTVSRGSIQTHIDRYCGYESVACPSDFCAETVPRRLVDEPCLHQSTICSDCGAEMMELALPTHQKESCTVAFIDCPDCDECMLKQDLDSHLKQKCAVTAIPCPAHEYGCDYTSRRSVMETHASSCALAKLAPFLVHQNTLIEEHTAALKHLQRKTQLHEDFLDTVRETLSDMPPLTTTSSAPETFTSLTLHSFPNAPTHALSSSSPSTQPRSTNQFTSPTSHLLHLHESLREELDRLSRAVSDLDARTDLSFLNASLRQKEEMTHRDAALAQVRAQVQWLVSGRLVGRERERARMAGNVNGSGSVRRTVAGGTVGAASNALSGEDAGEWEVGGGVEGSLGSRSRTGSAGVIALGTGIGSMSIGGGGMSRRPSDGSSVSGREKL